MGAVKSIISLIIVSMVSICSTEPTNVTIIYADGDCKNMNKTGLEMNIEYDPNANVAFIVNYPPLRRIKPLMIHGDIKPDFKKKRLKVEIGLQIEGDRVADAAFDIHNLSNISCQEYTFKVIRQVCLLSTLEETIGYKDMLFFCLELAVVDFEKSVFRGVDMGCFWANSTYISRDPRAGSPPIDKFLKIIASCDSASDNVPAISLITTAALLVFSFNR